MRQQSLGKTFTTTNNFIYLERLEKKSRSQLLALKKAKFIKIIKNVWKQTSCFSYHQRLKNKPEDLFWNKLYKGIATKLHIYLYDKFSTFVKYYNLPKRTTI